MKAFVVSLIALVAISLAAAYALDAMDWSAASKFTSDKGNVRL